MYVGGPVRPTIKDLQFYKYEMFCEDLPEELPDVKILIHNLVQRTLDISSDPIQREMGMAILLITHDLGVVAETCDEVVVMYAGRVVEQAPTEALFAAPRHHYTAGLLRSVPRYGETGRERTRLVEIKGMVPALADLPEGCKFADRCGAVRDRCRTAEPELVQLGASRVRCHFPVEVGAA